MSNDDDGFLKFGMRLSMAFGGLMDHDDLVQYNMIQLLYTIQIHLTYTHTCLNLIKRQRRK